jgi:hypothetical protein
MENIVIFIIIIIISSIISKNKKKQQEASRNSTETPRTPSRNTQTQPVTDLRELLKTLKNMDPEAAGNKRKTFTEMRKQTEQLKPAGDNEYSAKENYEETASYEESHKETYSYETAEKTYDTETKSYDEVAAYEEKNVNYDENKGSYMTSVRRQPVSETAAAGHRAHVKVNIFDTRSKLKNAIIASEILQRKYT